METVTVMLLDWGVNSKAGSYIDIGFYWGDKYAVDPFLRAIVELKLKHRNLPEIITDGRVNIIHKKYPWMRIEVEEAILEQLRGLEGEQFFMDLTDITDQIDDE